MTDKSKTTNASPIDAWVDGHSAGEDEGPRFPPDWFTAAAKKEWLRGYDCGIGWNRIPEEDDLKYGKD
jgi:hypothetical protein